ncbi:MAG: SocA family protein [Phycisphaerales bacterium]|nr:SocA family protein [Phycisphaerales bacterium]
MPVRVDAIANFFLERAEAAGKPLDQMKLQKLLYFSQGWHLALGDRPLFDEDFEAWRWGPVLRSLRSEFKNFGAEPITVRAKDVRFVPGKGIEPFIPSIADCPDQNLPYAQALLDRAWVIYGGYTGIQLSNMTHADGTPWKQIYDRFGGAIPHGITIPKDAMKAYFREQVSKISNG